MKKFTAIFLCVLLLGAMAVTVHATDSAHMTIGASDTTAYRGDTIDFTVSISTVEDCRSAIFMLAYDTSVFEFVSGSCSLSGTTLASFSSGTGTFAYSAGTTVSGQIFTFRLRVKDGAAVGSSSVTANVNTRTSSGEIPTSVNSVSITVTCDHSYGSWSKADENNHVRSCTKCGHQDTAAHAWDSGTVTKAPTCKETGEKAYSCTTCGASKTETLEKTADHSFGSWAKADDANHKRTCSNCGREETAAHTWDDGKVTKAPTCKDTGEKTHTCTACSATKTETLEKTADHSYSAWTKVDDSTHKHACTVCGREETAAHTWDGGKVTKQPTCKDAGEKTHTCTGCSATKTETLEKSDSHSYGAWTKVDDSTHKHACTVCGREETAAHTWNSGAVTRKATCAEEGVKTYTCTGCGHTKTEVIPVLTTHTYDHGCDRDCNVCGVIRATAHSFRDGWTKDQKAHWIECAVCGEKKESAAHTPGPAATEEQAQTCTICGYTIAPALGHEHRYADAWTTDAEGHWYACDGCEEPGSYAVHEFENDCDPDCAVCGHVREITHAYGGEWEQDAENHWHACAVCGVKADEEAHVPGAEATQTTAQTCTVCGRELAPALGGTTEPATEATGATHGTEPGGEDPANGGFPWWIVILAVVIAGGVVIFVIVKNKEKA